MNVEAIHATMAALARARPLFHSEADFQHAFAWQLHVTHLEARTRLETRPRPGGYLDVMALMGAPRCRRAEVPVPEAHDDGRGQAFRAPVSGGRTMCAAIDFVKDIARLELLLAEKAADDGFAVALTTALTGPLEWSADTGAGTMRRREKPIALAGRYELRWRDFSHVNAGRFGTFRYLVVAAERPA